VNRPFILIALLAIVLAACGTQESDPPDATLTPAPTPAPATDAPDDTDEPAATDDDDGDDDGSTGSLDDMIPDDLNGVAGTAIPGLDTMLSGALQAQGLDGDDAEFAFVTYGTDANAVVLQAFRIPGVEEEALQQLAQLMSAGGAGSEFDTATMDIGGKTVLTFSGGGQQNVVYFYVADDVAFTVAGEDAASVEQLLSELP
jgi:hypothetical protein